MNNHFVQFESMGKLVKCEECGVEFLKHPDFNGPSICTACAIEKTPPPPPNCPEYDELCACTQGNTEPDLSHVMGAALFRKCRAALAILGWQRESDMSQEKQVWMDADRTIHHWRKYSRGGKWGIAK